MVSRGLTSKIRTPRPRKVGVEPGVGQNDEGDSGGNRPQAQSLFHPRSGDGPKGDQATEIAQTDRLEEQRRHAMAAQKGQQLAPLFRRPHPAQHEPMGPLQRWIGRVERSARDVILGDAEHLQIGVEIEIFEQRKEQDDDRGNVHDRIGDLDVRSLAEQEKCDRNQEIAHDLEVHAFVRRDHRTEQGQHRRVNNDRGDDQRVFLIDDPVARENRDGEDEGFGADNVGIVDRGDMRINEAQRRIEGDGRDDQEAGKPRYVGAVGEHAVASACQIRARQR